MYKIAETCQILGISKTTLLKLEHEGVIKRARRIGLNRARVFSWEDIEEIKAYIHKRYRYSLREV